MGRVQAGVACRAFQDLPLDAVLMENVTNSYRDGPTVVQGCALPYLLDSSVNDFLVRSHTGSGKTATYLIPILQRAIEVKAEEPKRPPLSPIGLIVAPTKELAVQIAKEASMLARGGRSRR